LMDKVGAKVVAAAAVFTEGERAQWHDIIALGHLPLFSSDGKPRIETRKKRSRARG